MLTIIYIGIDVTTGYARSVLSDQQKWIVRTEEFIQEKGFFVMDDGECVAVCFYIEHNSKKGPLLYVTMIQTAKSHRHRGYASKALATLFEIAMISKSFITMSAYTHEGRLYLKNKAYSLSAKYDIELFESPFITSDLKPCSNL